MTLDERNRAMIRRHRAGDPDAIAELIEVNLGLARDQAYRLTRDESRREEYIQAGRVGLWRAAESFDLDGPVKYGTHAYWHIRREMQACRRDQYVIKPSPELSYDGKQFGEASEERQKHALRARSIRLGEDRLLDGMGREFIPDPHPGPEPLAILSEMSGYLHDATACLTPNQAEILAMRHPLDGQDPLTFPEIAERRDTRATWQAVQQCYRKCLLKLRKRLGNPDHYPLERAI